MVTNIDINEDLLRKARALGNHRTKKAAVNDALAEYVRVRTQREILKLCGKIDYDPDYDYKAERRAR